MKILLAISSELNPNSGAAGTTLRLGQEYQKLGHDVLFYSSENIPNLLPSLARLVTFPEIITLQALKLNNQQKLDVIDTPGGEGWLLKKTFQLFRQHYPLFVTRSHGLEHILHLSHLAEAQEGKLQLSWKYFLYRGSWRLWEEAQALRSSDLVFLLNREDKKYTVERLGVQSHHIHVVPNGIPDSFINLPFQPISAQTASLRIAQIGSYIPRKGVEFSVPALRSVLSQFPEVEVSFLGTGCEPEKVYADFPPHLRHQVKVISHYKLEDLPTLLTDYHIKLFTPLSEAFGKVLVEAMACGLAPVTTSAPGPMEVVSHEYDALVVPPRNSRAIEQALKQLIMDRKKLDYLRHNAYQTAQTYSWQQIAQNRLRLYEEAIELKSRK